MWLFLSFFILIIMLSTVHIRVDWLSLLTHFQSSVNNIHAIACPFMVAPPTVNRIFENTKMKRRRQRSQPNGETS